MFFRFFDLFWFSIDFLIFFFQFVDILAIISFFPIFFSNFQFLFLNLFVDFSVFSRSLEIFRFSEYPVNFLSFLRLPKLLNFRDRFHARKLMGTTKLGLESMYLTQIRPKRMLIDRVRLSNGD